MITKSFRSEDEYDSEEKSASSKIYEKIKLTPLDISKDASEIEFLESFTDKLRVLESFKMVKIKLVFGNSQWYSGQLAGEMEHFVWAKDSQSGFKDIFEHPEL